MSGAATLRQSYGETIPRKRSCMQQLLHALNQPLTGLQCSLELAASGPRSNEQYRSTLREGLELTSRMRVLVEAIREVADAAPSEIVESAEFSLLELVRETADDLGPVALENRINVVIDGDDCLTVRANKRRWAALMFRLLDSTLSLASSGGTMQIAICAEASGTRLSVTLSEVVLPEHSPVSRQELGLLVAQAGWEQAGAQWSEFRRNRTLTCALILPGSDSSAINESQAGDEK